LIIERANAYKVAESNNLLILMGGEFSFSDAEEYFKYSEAMIDFYNEKEG
jgi:hypothetical protein